VFISVIKNVLIKNKIRIPNTTQQQFQMVFSFSREDGKDELASGISNTVTGIVGSGVWAQLLPCCHKHRL
jgi:hypothetical protein